MNVKWFQLCLNFILLHCVCYPSIFIIACHFFSCFSVLLFTCVFPCLQRSNSIAQTHDTEVCNHDVTSCDVTHCLWWCNFLCILSALLLTWKLTFDHTEFSQIYVVRKTRFTCIVLSSHCCGKQNTVKWRSFFYTFKHVTIYCGLYSRCEQFTSQYWVLSLHICLIHIVTYDIIRLYPMKKQ